MLFLCHHVSRVLTLFLRMRVYVCLPSSLLAHFLRLVSQPPKFLRLFQTDKAWKRKGQPPRGPRLGDQWAPPQKSWDLWLPSGSEPQLWDSPFRF